MRSRPVLLFAFLVSLAATPGRAVEVWVGSSPANLDAWAGEQYLGRTPVGAVLPEGVISLRLAIPSDSIYHPPAVDTLLCLAEDKPLRLFFRVGDLVSVRSEPFGLRVLRDGRTIGETPLNARIDPTASESMELLTPGGLIPIPTDTLLATGSWTWRGEPLRIASRTRHDRPFWRKVGRYVTPGVAIALATAGLIVEDEADEAYRRYLTTAEPNEIDRYYDRARRRDAWAAALWVGAEISLVSALASWILPEGRPERNPQEGR